MNDPVSMAKEMAQIVRDAVARAVGPLEARIKQLEELPPSAAGEPGTNGNDGASVTLEQVLAVVEPAVTERLAAIPVPADGNDGASVTLEQVLAVVEPAVAERLAAIPVPADGKSLSLDDIRPLYETAQAQWALDFERRAQSVLERAIDKIPRPKDGRDALDIQDFELDISEDGRTLTVRLKRGDVAIQKSVKIPSIQYKHVHEADGAYECGDVVAWDGSSWICEKDGATARPSAPNSGWRLVAKKGRDGRDGRNGIDMTKPVKVSA